MLYKTVYWDEVAKIQRERDCTPEEVADIEARKSALPTVPQYIDAVQNVLDTEARSKGYDDIVSACSYAGAPNPFQAESQSYVTWRGNVWASCYQVLAEVQGGQRPQPTISQLLSELPEAP